MSSRKLILTGLLLGLATIIPARAEPKAGDVFPPLDAFPMEGGVLPATSGRVIMVDFCASWCAPCRASFPAYAQLQGDFSQKGLVIVGVSVDEDPAKFAAFVKQLAPPFTVVCDRTHALVERVQVAAMPTSFLLDRTGRVRFVHHGFHGADTTRELRHEIESLLAEPSPKP